MYDVQQNNYDHRTIWCSMSNVWCSTDIQWYVSAHRCQFSPNLGWYELRESPWCSLHILLIHFCWFLHHTHVTANPRCQCRFVLALVATSPVRKVRVETHAGREAKASSGAAVCTEIPGPYRSQWCADRFPSPLFSPSEYFPRTWRIPIISRWKAVQNHHFVVPSLDKWPKPRCGDPPEQELETRKAPLSQFPLLPKVAHVSQARNHADHRKNLRRNHKELGDCTNNNGKSQVIWRI